MKIETNAPIDFVVTWVDGEDPAWCAQKAEWLAKVGTEVTTDWLAGNKRYRETMEIGRASCRERV
mgnify:CR=1 FL=1